MSASMRLKKAERTPTSGRPTPPSCCLPLPFLGDASRRLGWASLIYAFAFLSAYFVSALPVWIRTGTLAENLTKPNSIVAFASILMSFFMFWLSRSRRLSPQRLLDVGLIYLVVGSFGISMAEFWGVYPDWLGVIGEEEFVGIPWECVWIIIFPILAPNTHRKTFLASVAAASTGLLVVTLSRSFGPTSTDAPVTFFIKYFLFTSYLCAVLSLATCRVIHGFGKHLHRAEEIGSYRLVERLGMGGMGEVWKASHRMLARPAAIKLIRPGVLGADESTRREAIRRFEREAQATAALQSYHTIGLYDFGVTDDGSFYYVMELLDGLNLDVLVRRFGPVPAERAVHLMSQVCHSLMEAHGNGMVHRDIKPANIYTCRLGPDRDFVKVLDFGLVKSSKDIQKGETELTVLGVAAGTPGFMAPEMAVGKGGIDGRADIYSLGCVAYWLVTGQLVFEEETPLATIVQHIQAVPVPPSQRSELEVPEPLEKLILSCLQKDPAARPQSAREVAQQLALCEMDGVWSTEKAEEWWDLHMSRPQQYQEEDSEREKTTRMIGKRLESPSGQPK